ncbi:hypothetical protein B0T17DRAFT_617112 [Bombardia bombarda]|uniref:Uncharacterized protein n=1 Tax=Bombardia bombarda TaxID=252184 RepID=A0AA40C4Q6_9PEZI|nr:hypothetical protein B0T17DRAFT_617112 [Bombardia bombarda]
MSVLAPQNEAFTSCWHSNEAMQTTIDTKDSSYTSSEQTLTMVPSGGSLFDYFDSNQLELLKESLFIPPPSPPQTPDHHLLSPSRSSSSLSSARNHLLFLNRQRSQKDVPPYLRQFKTRRLRYTNNTKVHHSPSPSKSSLLSPATTHQVRNGYPTPPSSASGGSPKSVFSVDDDMSYGEIITIRRTPQFKKSPYYPPNSSVSGDRTRIYMNRGAHSVPNWTPLSSLPQHVQREITGSSKMVQFVAPKVSA